VTTEILDQALAPVLDFLAELEPNDESRSKLVARFPLDGAEMIAVASAFAAGVEEGWLCDRQGSEHVTYSRVRKAGEGELSVDAVRMAGPGPGHLHPSGEFDLCFAIDGTPLFDGKPPGWVVYPAGSWHVPTVEGGTMNILYFLPNGAIKFGPKPD